MTRFASKRNNVYLKDSIVYKEFCNQEAAKVEEDILVTLRQAQTRVPKVIQRQNNILQLEYIEGITIPDFLVTTSSLKDCDSIASSIIRWLIDFYRAVNNPLTNEIRGDINGRNFIISKDGIYGVDFEERIYGTIERDIGRLLAYVSTYRVKNYALRKRLTEDLFRYANELLPVEADLLLEEMDKEKLSMKLRRQKRLNL